MAIEWSEKARTWWVSTGHTHVQATSNAGTLQRLIGTVLLTDGHETRHLDLGELDLPATEGSQGLKGETER